ncbi:hypothetical protein [Microbacterium lacticum]
MSQSDRASAGPAEGTSAFDSRKVRRAVLIVAALNFAYFFVEFFVALSSG